MYIYIYWKSEVAKLGKVRGEEDEDFIVDEFFINGVNRFFVLEGGGVLGGGGCAPQAAVQRRVNFG